MCVSITVLVSVSAYTYTQRHSSTMRFSYEQHITDLCENYDTSKWNDNWIHALLWINGFTGAMHSSLLSDMWRNDSPLTTTTTTPTHLLTKTIMPDNISHCDMNSSICCNDAFQFSFSLSPSNRLAEWFLATTHIPHQSLLSEIDVDQQIHYTTHNTKPSSAKHTKKKITLITLNSILMSKVSHLVNSIVFARMVLLIRADCRINYSDANHYIQKWAVFRPNSIDCHTHTHIHPLVSVKNRLDSRSTTAVA